MRLLLLAVAVGAVLMATSFKGYATPPATPADRARGYLLKAGQSITFNDKTTYYPDNYTIYILDDAKAQAWAASLGGDQRLTWDETMAQMFDGHWSTIYLDSGLISRDGNEGTRDLYRFVHRLKASAVVVGKYDKEAFNDEVRAALLLFQKNNIKTADLPGELT